MKGYKEWNPRQGFLLPPNPLEWLPDHHVVHFLLDVVADLDVSEMEEAIQAKDHRGTRPFPPRMMVAVLLYGYCVGTVSSRKLEAATYNDIGFRVLCGGNHPDHSTICNFRKRFINGLAGLFVQVLRLCQEAGLVKLGHVALDGTKMQGNASKHKAMSHSRMKKKEAELEAEIKALLEQAEKVDAAEDEQFGKDKRGDELPDELRFKEKRRQKIREAREALEAEAARAHAEHKRELAKKAAREAEEAEGETVERAHKRAARGEKKARESASRAVEKAEARAANAAEEADRLESSARTPAAQRQATAASKKLKAAQRDLEKAKALESTQRSEDGNDALPEHRVPFDRHGDPKPNAQRNFTDPDSRIMKAGDGYLQGYNCQAAVDEASQIIVAHAATNQPPDQEHLRPMLDQVIENCDQAPATFTADAGYWSAENAKYCESRDTDAYISPNRKPDQAEEHGVDSDESQRRDAMRSKVTSDTGKAIYAKRKWTVEPVFGQIKEARGFRRFLLRGIDLVRGEWALVCTAHNLLKLFGALSARCRPDTLPGAP